MMLWLLSLDYPSTIERSTVVIVSSTSARDLFVL